MEHIRCIFCDRDSGQVVIEENGYMGRKCPECGLIFISPRPTFAEITDLYASGRAHASAETHISGEFLKRLCARHTLSIIRRYVSAGSVLEIGAGAGYFLDEARKQGFEVSGIELENVQAEFINDTLGIPCESTPLSKASFGDKEFDVIYHCDVLSHFHDPVAEFRTMHRKLRSDGALVFETGNLADVHPKHHRLVPSFQYPDHLFFFGEGSLAKLLEVTGFELIKVYKYDIAAQLMASRALKAAANLRAHIRTVERNACGPPRHDVGCSVLQRTHSYAAYLLRYKIGYLLPKKDRPQTIIVVARKKTSCSANSGKTTG